MELYEIIKTAVEEKKDRAAKAFAGVAGAGAGYYGAGAALKKVQGARGPVTKMEKAKAFLGKTDFSKRKLPRTVRIGAKGLGAIGGATAAAYGMKKLIKKLREKNS